MADRAAMIQRMALPEPIGVQKTVVALRPSGHVVVLGTAGSGKTTMAVHRAAHVSDPRIPSHGQTQAARAASVAAYEHELRQTCNAPGCEIAVIPAISHDALVPKAVAKIKPFGPKGTGYRDALIWQTVLAEAAAGRVAFVTGNTADFCNEEEAGLVEDLVGELNLQGLPRTQVAWYRDLKSFVEEVIPAADRWFEEVRDRLANDPDFKWTTSSVVSAAAEDFSLDHGWDAAPNPSGALDLPTDSSEPTVVFYEPKQVEVDDAHEVEGGEIILDLTTRGEAEIDFFAPKWSAFSEEADISIEDSDWNEWMVWARATRDLDLQMTVSYDPQTHALSNADITSWEAVERTPED